MKKMLLMMIAALCACPSAYADNWYIGFGAGGSRSVDAGNNIADGHTNLRQYGVTNFTSSDRTDTVLSVFGGYHFNHFLGAELDYTDLGTYDARGFAGPNFTLPTGRERDEINVLSLEAVLTAPIGDAFAVYGKIGPALANVDESTCVSSVRFCDTSSDTTGAMHGSVGVRLTPASLIGEIRLEYSRFHDVNAGSKQFTGGDFNVWQVQYVYDFGED